MEKQLSRSTKVESRADLVAAMVRHALAKLEAVPWENFVGGRGETNELRNAKFGDFYITHFRSLDRRNGLQLLDVHYGRKVLALRDDGDGWKLVSLKRGDWESAFLLT